MSQLFVVSSGGVLVAGLHESTDRQSLSLLVHALFLPWHGCCGYSRERKMQLVS